MVAAIMAILAGLLLLSGVLRRGSAPGKVAAALRPFEVVIGVVALVVGVLNITSVIGVALIIAGLALAAEAMTSIPGIGDELQRAGNALRGFSAVIGLLVLILGIIQFFRILL